MARISHKLTVDASGDEYDGVRVDDREFYTRYARYRDITDQMTDQIASATRIDSKENGYQRETLYRTPNGYFAKMIERVNNSGPTIIEISYAEVVEWYKLDVPGPIEMGPGRTISSVFGAPRFHAPGGCSSISIARRPGQTFAVNAYPPRADLLGFADINETMDLQIYSAGAHGRNSSVATNRSILAMQSFEQYGIKT